MTKRKRVSDIEFWDLLFVWNLFFVIWNFAADAVHPAEMPHGVEYNRRRDAPRTPKSPHGYMRHGRYKSMIGIVSRNQRKAL